MEYEHFLHLMNIFKKKEQEENHDEFIQGSVGQDTRNILQSTNLST